MSKYLYFFILLCFQAVLCFSSDRKNSNQDQSGIIKQDTAIINQMNSTAYYYRRSKPDTAFYLANKALKFSLTSDYKKGIANAYLNLGYTHLINYSKNDSASIYIQWAYDVFKQSNDKLGMGMACFGMAYVHSFKGNLKESESSLQDCLHFFEMEGHKRGIYNAYNSLAYIYQQYKDYPAAFDYIQSAIKTATETGDSTLIADANNSLGNIYKDQYLFQQAIDIYFKALNLWELKNDSNGMAIAYGNIGLMYYYQNDFSKALEYYKKKLPLTVKAMNKWEESRTYNDIGFVYLSGNQNDTALSYYRKGLQMNNLMNYPPGIADSYYNIANTYLKMSLYDSAMTYIKESIVIAETINTRARLAGNYVLLGKIKYASGNLNSALINTLKGYNIGKELKIPDVINEASELLSNIYASINRYDLAFNYLMEYKQMQDSINKEENIKKIARLEIQYEFDKKQRRIDYEQEQVRLAHKTELKQQRLFFHGALILSAFIIFSSILFIRQKNLQAKLKNIDLEQKLLRVQMNPHFIFNSLCIIQDYILNNKPQEANAFLSRFAALMRAILETSRQDFVILEKEIQTLKNYIEIQKLRFEADFDYSFEIDEKIDIDSVAIPPMLVQPFIENSIEHGLLPRKEKGILAIKYHFENGLIRIMIEDNGIGRKKSEALKPDNKHEKQSLATLLTKERINYLKKSIHKKTDFTIEDICGKPYKSGTRVIFKIPFRYENI